ncbi:MAG: alkaline phosphatase family protein [Paludibacteraceae bacterium]|nr:alkaline phosphatase family protein [Paludibacteraceae bacterium]
MRKFVCTIICAVLANFAEAQQQTVERPLLVVGVSVGHLNEAYLSMYWSNMGSGGFRRLAESGTAFEDGRYAYYSTSDLVDVVTVATGAEPVQHGVQSEKSYQTKTGKFEWTAQDKSVTAINGSWRISGRVLPVTTLADELFESTYGQSKIVSIAADPQISSLQAGHCGLALWLDNLKGTWASSSYYASKLPAWATRKSADDYLSQTWEPKFPLSYYMAYADKKKYAFKYNLKDVCANGRIYENFVTTPMANTAVRELAEAAIQNEKMGADLNPDLLLLHFSLQPFFKSDGAAGYEVEDAYLRLDGELESLMKMLDRQVGKGKWLLYLTGSRSVPDYRRSVNEKLPAESFCSERYATLLNSYLMALYGQNKWVTGYNAGRIYLNRKLIGEKNLSLKEMQEKSVEFFALIPGVADVSTSYRLADTMSGDGSLQLPFSRYSEADLYFRLAPGWYEVDMKGIATGFQSTTDRSVLFYLCGWKIENRVVREPVEVLGLTGSLVKWLGLMPPSGSTGARLP